MRTHANAVGAEFVRAEVRADGVATILLDRPERRNALNDQVIAELVAAVDDLGADPGARVIVLKANGPTFCAGADATSITGGAEARSPVDDRRHMLEARVGRFVALWDSPVPVIAQVHGHCLAGGIALCSCADLVVVADDAVIGWPLPLGGGMIGPTMALHIGVRRAKELSFVPMSTLSGAEAAALGWANRAVPAAALDTVVDDLARRIATVPRGVLQMKKAAINATYDRLGFREAVHSAATWNALAHTDPGLDELRDEVRRDGLRAVSDRFRRVDPS